MPASPPPEEETASDAALIARIAARDRAAFERLFDRYAGRIRGYLMRSGASAQDADELAQDVMVSVWRNAGSFDPTRAAASTWIFTIARNRRIDLLRRGRRPEPDPADPLFQPDPAPDGMAVVSMADRERLLRQGLATLSDEQRAVLEAAFYQGLTHSEIAARLGLPLGTVKSRIRLAFRHLRDALGDDLAEDLDDL
jgi:RNA polymerase sigma-70 factor, ECF subfamily